MCDSVCRRAVAKRQETIIAAVANVRRTRLDVY